MFVSFFSLLRYNASAVHADCVSAVALFLVIYLLPALAAGPAVFFEVPFAALGFIAVSAGYVFISFGVVAVKQLS